MESCEDGFVSKKDLDLFQFFNKSDSNKAASFNPLTTEASHMDR